MNWKSPSMIVSYCLFVVTIICFALIFVTNIFAIIGSVCLTIGFFIFTWWASVDFLKFKRQQDDNRLSDAYLYAEEIGNEQAMENFMYDKKVEKKLKYDRMAHRFIPMTFGALTMLSMFLIIVCIRII